MAPFHLHHSPATAPHRLLVPLGYRAASIVWTFLSVLLIGVLAKILCQTMARVSKAAPVKPTVFFSAPRRLAAHADELRAGAVVGDPGRERSACGIRRVGSRATHVRRDVVGRGRRAQAHARPSLPLRGPARSPRGGGLCRFSALCGPGRGDAPLSGGLDAVDGSLSRHPARDVTHWRTWWHNTLSLRGLVARLFIGAHVARPLTNSPRLAVGLIAGDTRSRSARSRSRRRAEATKLAERAYDDCVFALWNVLVVVLNPLAWAHYGLLLPASRPCSSWRAVEEPGLSAAKG